MSIKHKVSRKSKSKKGKFVVPTKEEIFNDRKDYISRKKAEIIRDGDNLVRMMLNLNLQETVIETKMNQLGVDINGEKVSDIVIKELTNGMIKPLNMLKAELSIAVYNYKSQIREFDKLKQKFVTEYNFNPTDVKKILEDTFDWVKWGLEYVDDNNELIIDDKKYNMKEELAKIDTKKSPLKPESVDKVED